MSGKGKGRGTGSVGGFDLGALEAARQKPVKQRSRVMLAADPDLSARLGNAAYHYRRTLRDLTDEALRRHVEALETEHGGVFPPRPEGGSR